MNYDVKTWNQMPLYQCRLCPYDTLNESEMTAHQVNVHEPPAKPQVVQMQVLDRFGNVVEGEVVDVVIPAEVILEEPKSGTKKATEGTTDAEDHTD